MAQVENLSGTALRPDAVTKSVLGSVLMFSISFGMMLPALPNLIIAIEDVNMSEATLLGGYVAASYAFFQFLLGPTVGNLSDRFGRRPVFLACLAGFALDLLVMAFATSIFWLFIGRSVAGCFGLIFGPANAIMADISKAEGRARAFGLTAAAFGLGLIIGPLLGGYLGEFGVRTPFFAGAGIALINLVFSAVLIPETLAQTKRRKFELSRATPVGTMLSLSTHAGVSRFAITIFIWLISFGIFQTTWVFFSSIKYGWDSSMIGVSLAIIGGSVVVIQGIFMGKLIGKLGERRTALLGMIVAVLTCLGFILSDLTVLGLILCGFVGFQALVVPSLIAVMSRILPDDMQGELQGFFSSATALANLLAPLIYNTALSYFTGATAPFQFAGFPFVIALAFIVASFVLLVRAD